jgi:hypothetical protein
MALDLGIVLQTPVFELPHPIGEATAITIGYHEKGYWLIETLGPDDQSESLFFDDDGQQLPSTVGDE